MTETQPPVLLVDDQPKLARLVTELLKRLGFPEVDEANDGMTALEMMRQRKYGLVISDWDMEPIDGFQLLKQVRSDPALANIPFIITESSITFEQVTLAHMAGVDAFLLKPFDLSLLKRKLKTVLSQHMRRRPRSAELPPTTAMEFAALGRGD